MPAPFNPTNTARNLIQSIRAKIPDTVADAADNGTAFTADDLMRWINDAGRQMCNTANVISDWFAIPSEAGMDLYVLPSYVTNVEQAWYDLQPLGRSPELDHLWYNKVEGMSWWFGPHSTHATPRLHVWPVPTRTAATALTTAPITVTGTSFSVSTGITGFQEMGMARFIDDDNPDSNELVIYRTIDVTNPLAPVLRGILRGQGGTLAASWDVGSTLQECNIMLKCFRLPRAITSVDDPIEIPEPLWPVLELYVLANIREAEQEYGYAQQLRKEFREACQTLGEKSSVKGLRQGLQIKYHVGPELHGHWVIP